MCQLLLRVYSSPASGWGDSGPPRRAGASQPAPAWRSRGSPSGKEGKEKCKLPAVAALVTRQDARPGRALNEEKGGRGGELLGRTLRGVRREEFEARIWTVSPGCAGVEWRGWLLLPPLPRVPSVRPRATGTLWPLAQGAGPARRRRREGPPRVPGEPAGFPRCLPRPPPQSWRRKGAGGLVGGHSEFPATFPGCGKRAVLQS